MIQKTPIGLLILVFLFCFAGEAHALNVSKQTYQRRLRESKLKKSSEQYSTKHFDIYSDLKLSHSAESQIRRFIDREFETMARFFGYSIKDKFQLVLMTGGSYQNIDLQDISTLGYYENNRIRVKWNNGKGQEAAFKEFKSVFSHELTHLIVADVGVRKIPKWLNEGLAVYFATEPQNRKSGDGRRFYQSMKARGRTPDPKAFFAKSVNKRYKESMQEFYQHGYVLARYLADVQGERKLRALFKTIREGNSFSSSFKKVYQMSPEEMALKAYRS